MKLPLLGDTHFGARGNSHFFLSSCADFFDNVFFPYMRENNLTEFVQLGDLMESRKAVGMTALNTLRTKFLEPLEEHGIRGHFIPGNHDILHNNTSELNWLNELIPAKQYPTQNVIQRPTTLDFDGTNIDIVPWINKENEEASLEFIKNSTSAVNLGHYDIIGFEMVSGVACIHGFDRKMFKHYKIVVSGHYHNYSQDDNITYSGCPYAFNWNDYGHRKGFLVLDTSTLELEYVENPRTDFHKIIFNDEETDYAEYDFTPVENAFVKLIVDKQTDDKLFEEFTTKLEDIAYMVDVMDMREIIPDEGDVDISVEDTTTILNRTVDEVETNLDRERVKVKLHEILVEAEEQMVV